MCRGTLLSMKYPWFLMRPILMEYVFEKINLCINLICFISHFRVRQALLIYVKTNLQMF